MNLRIPLALLLAGLVPLASASADGWGEVASERVADGIHVLRAHGGNIGAVIGPDGVFLIDDQFAPLTAKIRARLDALDGAGTAPVRFVLNTHFHGDHTGGNENLGNAGAVIVAHDNVRARMSTEEFRAQFIERGGDELTAALPVVTFNDRVTFHLNGHTLETRHYPHAHTDGDSVVWFREANVVHMGDIFFQAEYPFIDRENGGSVTGVIAAVNDVLERADERTIVIPGHGERSNRAELAEYRDMLVALRDAVAERRAAGRSLDEVQALKLTHRYDARWSGNFVNGPRMVETLYRSLAAESAHADGDHSH